MNFYVSIQYGCVIKKAVSIVKCLDEIYCDIHFYSSKFKEVLSAYRRLVFTQILQQDHILKICIV